MVNSDSKHTGARAGPGVKWSGRFRVAQSQIQQTREHSNNVRKPLPPGDKIILPSSVLPGVLSAAAASNRSNTELSSTSHPTLRSPVGSGLASTKPSDISQNPDHHPYGHSEDLHQSQQLLSQPLTFRIVNAANERVVYAGVREFSAEEGEVVLSSFLKNVLGTYDVTPLDNVARNNDALMREADEEDHRPLLAIHAVQLPKGTHVKLRPLEAGYDPEDWKALLEEHLRTNYTTLTRGEILAVPSGRLRKEGISRSSHEGAHRIRLAVENNGTGGDRRAGGNTENGVEEGDTFKFIIDAFQPESDGICIVDTDLEVDIEALNEEQARETVKRITAKAKASNRLNGIADVGVEHVGSSKESDISRGGNLDLFKPQNGVVTVGNYIDYEISSWDRTRGLEITLEMGDDIDDTDHTTDTTGNQSSDNESSNGCMLDLLVSPFGARQRERPRTDRFVRADFDETGAKRIGITPAEMEEMMGVGQTAQAIWVAVHSSHSSDTNSAHENKININERKTTRKRMFKISVSVVDSTADGPLDAEFVSNTASTGIEKAGETGEVQCKNCNQWVPEQRLILHENFCLRNNIRCKECGKVFQKRSLTWEQHWHCHLPHYLSSKLLVSVNHKSELSSSLPSEVSFHGNTSTSYSKHIHLFHTTYSCSACARNDTKTFPSLIALAHHRTTTCPAKPILCQFCHLLVPQGGDPDADVPVPEVVVSGLTPHELEDGARTTECHLCNRIVRLRDMSSHLLHHEIEKKRRVAPRVCRNILCGKLVVGGAASSNSNSSLSNNIGLCGTCYGPLYVAQYDPDGKGLRRRVERRYLSQLLTGCGRPWCANKYCKTGRMNQEQEKSKDNGTDNSSTDESKTLVSMTTRTALPLIKPFLEGLFEVDNAEDAKSANGATTTTDNSVAISSKPAAHQMPLHFCVDGASQRRRTVAEVMAATTTTAANIASNISSHARANTVGKARRWALGWWITALELKGTENIEGAIAWLEGYAPEIEG